MNQPPFTPRALTLDHPEPEEAIMLLLELNASRAPNRDERLALEVLAWLLRHVEIPGGVVGRGI